MARYLLHHRHEPDECGVVFASSKGHDSPLRHRPTLASCRTGGHAIWWTVEAGSEADARSSEVARTETLSAHSGHRGRAGTDMNGGRR
jgi:hypothetical protein